MPATLYLVPTLHAAFQHAQEQIRRAREARPLAPVHVLMPGAEAIFHARARFGNALGLRMTEFYALAHAILDRVAHPVWEVNDNVLRRLARRLLAEMAEAGELSTFGAVAGKPGFQQAVLQWLREMKSQGISPEEVWYEARRSGLERDRQLALLYERYQGFLEAEGLSDADGLLWLAAEALETDGDLFDDVACFLVIGFDQFSPLQYRILAELAARLPALSVYLPWEPALSGESIALTRLRDTREKLERWLEATVRHLEAGPADPPALVAIRQGLFEPEREAAADSNPPVVRAVEAPSREAAADSNPPVVRAVEAPSREAEVRQALRAIKGLLLQGVRPGEVALLAPQPGIYSRVVRAVADEYGVPVQNERRLVLNPAVRTALNLLQLSPDFPWRATCDALRSPYNGQPWLTLDQMDQLDILTRERPVVGGKNQWRAALRPIELQIDEEADDELGPPPLAATLPPEELEAIEEGLSRFFEQVSPPATGSYREHTAWIQAAILGLSAGSGEEEARAGVEEKEGVNLVARCEEGPFVARDRDALELFLRCARALVHAAEIVPPAEGSEVPWPSYRAELMQAVEGASIRPEPALDVVRFGALEAGRAVSSEHLFVLGLSEGEFPGAPQPDPFYTLQERAESPLPLVSTAPAENASLWWQVASNCRQSLWLSRPRLDESGVPWLPSPYWEATISRVEGLSERVETPPIAAVPTAEQAASAPELLLALAAIGAERVPPQLGEAWAAARVATEVMAQRARWKRPGPYEGIFGSEDLKQELAERFGEGHGWSASQLGSYARCPYGFFAERVLKLEARPDPVEGLDARQRGSLLHAILERLHGKLVEQALAPSVDNLEAILDLLSGCCDDLFPGAPQRYGFQPGPLWRYEQDELRRMTRALVAWECAQESEAFRPYRQEVRFGLRGSELPRLTLQGGDGVRFDLHGVIDRVDINESGAARVIDYKSGSAPYSKADVERGLALQVALYTVAAEALMPAIPQVVESAYLHIPSRAKSGILRFTGAAREDESVRAAVESAARAVAEARVGRFPSAPAKPERSSACGRTCDFAGLCAVTRTSIAKARRLLE